MDGNIPQKHPKSDADTTAVDGPIRKRSRRSKNNNNRNNIDDCYSNVSYQERNSSGRPGSPHRYFEHSYDVSFLTDAVVSSAATVGTDEQIVVTAAASAATVDNEQHQQQQHQQQEEEQSTKTTAGQQVVHRHVNGLCIVTAGNVLQLATTATTSLQEKPSSNADSREESQQQQQHQQTLAISSIKYLVKVAPDAQSAKGKLRAKNKKRRKNNNNSNINNDKNNSGSMKKNNIDSSSQSQAEDINNYDGEVSPTDPLCDVYLTNGTKITLQCCVHGTVIELNRRIGDNNDVGEEERNVESSKRGGGNASLLVTDPLLDGYLAVIMPNRGSYLPTVTHNQDGGSEK